MFISHGERWSCADGALIGFLIYAPSRKTLFADPKIMQTVVRRWSEERVKQKIRDFNIPAVYSIYVYLYMQIT
jgi:hypothetical protein